MSETLTVDALNYVIYAGTFLGFLILFTGMAQLVRRGENRSEARSRRMQMINSGASVEEILALLKPETSGGALSRFPLLARLPNLLAQAGMTIAPDRFLILIGVATAALFLVAAVVLPPLVAVFIAVAIGALAPLAVVKSRRDARVEKLVSQLPDALELLARGLRVGHPLNASIATVASEMADPIGTEFGLIFDQVNFGDDLVDAFEDFADRVAIEDVQYLAASIGIQHGTGGDLSRIISVLSKVIRDRLAMRRRVRAISSEGRLTAIFLSALPPLIFVFTTLSSPGYYTAVSDDPLFAPMIAAIVTLTVLNYLVLRRLVNFRF